MERRDDRRGGLLALAACAAWMAASAAAWGQDAAAPHWIWRAGTEGRDVPAETAFFRKEVFFKEPTRLALLAAADNAFELFLDGKKIAAGADWQFPTKVDVKVETGRHVLSAWASNEAPGLAGFLVSGGALPLGQGAPVHTNPSWKATVEAPKGDAWKTLDFDDSSWQAAADFGEFGVEPWGRLALGLGDASDRFKPAEGLVVETAAPHAVTGSVVAFAFDPDGAPCVSIERGPIARLVDEDKDGKYDSAVVIASVVTNCQGLYFHKDVLYVVGHGPQEDGLHVLTDEDKDGVFEKAELIRGAIGGMGEHGPHAIQVGPDGRLYYNTGNHSHMKPPIDPASPVNVAYEGELLPHMNDARGHAAGIMAPGGEILRSDDEGKSWKRLVAGFRNEYDFAFDSKGELFTFDSDMEWDQGLPWYRPVRVNHGAIGAEFGWRNGAAKWPPYYFDSLPAALDLGRGSPTGVTFYEASLLPEEYRGAFLICDWSQGRILAVTLKPEGSTYVGQAKEIVSGQPLNCTYVEVGPDGCIYFTTGGRGTQGGLFRLKPTAPPQARPAPADWLADALDVDSPLSSYARKHVETLKAANADAWAAKLEGAARDASGRTTAARRIRALDVLSTHGPEPTEALLVALAADPDADVRGRAVSLLAFHPTDASRKALTTALDDKAPFVRRRACESLMQQPAETIPVPALLPLLAEPDRFLRASARVAIEHAGPDRFRDALLTVENPRAKLDAMLALVRASTLDQKAQDDLFDRELVMLRETLDPALQLDLTRLIGLTYLQGPRKAEAPVSADFRGRLLAMYSRDADTPLNREVGRLLAFLGEPEAVVALLDHQDAVADTAAQILDAHCLRVLKTGWTPEAKSRYWAWFDRASLWDGGFSFLGYLDAMIREWLPVLTDQERAELLAQGEKHPFPTRVLARELDEKNPATVAELAGLYGRMVAAKVAGIHADDLKSTILEKLGRSPGAEARAALRSLLESDPSSRDRLIRALAERPSKEDLPILASALDSRDANTLRLALHAVARIDAVPDGPEAPAALIRLARRGDPALQMAIRQIARRWIGRPSKGDAASFETEVAFWDRSYREKFPDGPATTETAAAPVARDLADLVKNVLQADVMKTASAERGKTVLAKIRCLDCHKFGDQGQGLGPDLTTVNSRFQPVDVLESIVLPSKVISDQYKPTVVATDDGRVLGGMPIVADGPTLVLLLSDGSKVSIPKDEIAEQKASAVSVMPEGLLDPLSYQEIADMLALFESIPRVAAPEQAAGR